MTVLVLTMLVGFFLVGWVYNCVVGLMLEDSSATAGLPSSRSEL